MREGSPHKTISVIIPARIGSTRLPEKPLVKILGVELIKWMLNIVKPLVHEKICDLVVATDSPKIVDICEKNGVQATLTPSDIPSGTLRAIFTYQALNLEHEWMVNLQCDEPLLTSRIIADFFMKLDENKFKIWTMACLLFPRELFNPSVVKVLCYGNVAISFFRIPPYYPCGEMLRHVGVYAFHRSIIKDVQLAGTSPVSKMESLEQIEWMRTGIKIGVYPVREKLIGIDTPEDVVKAERQLRRKQARIFNFEL